MARLTLSHGHTLTLSHSHTLTLSHSHTLTSRLVGGVFRPVDALGAETYGGMQAPTPYTLHLKPLTLNHKP